MTSPAGFVLYILSSVAKVPVWQVIRMCLPWTVPLLVVLMLITYIPALVMCLPRVLGFIF